MFDTGLIKAGRAMLDWSQEDLARAAGVSKNTIAQLEQGLTNPTEKTERLIRQAFERADIEIRDGRIGRAAESLKVFEGPDCYLRLLDDVVATLTARPKSELLIFFGNDGVSPPPVIEKYRQLRNAGVRMRQLVKEGNTYLMGALYEYRYVPENFFVNEVMCVYDEKVAVVVKGAKKRIVLFRNPGLATAQKNLFELVWSTLKVPEKSDAEEKF